MPSFLIIGDPNLRCNITQLIEEKGLESYAISEADDMNQENFNRELDSDYDMIFICFNDYLPIKYPVIFNISKKMHPPIYFVTSNETDSGLNRWIGNEIKSINDNKFFYLNNPSCLPDI